MFSNGLRVEYVGYGPLGDDNATISLVTAQVSDDESWWQRRVAQSMNSLSAKSGHKQVDVADIIVPLGGRSGGVFAEAKHE